MTRAVVLIALCGFLTGCTTFQRCARDYKGDISVGILGTSFKGKATIHCEPTIITPTT